MTPTQQAIQIASKLTKAQRDCVVAELVHCPLHVFNDLAFRGLAIRRRSGSEVLTELGILVRNILQEQASHD